MFSHSSVSSETHVSLPSLGICHWDEERLEHLLRMSLRLDHRKATGLGETLHTCKVQSRSHEQQDPGKMQ